MLVANHRLPRRDSCRITSPKKQSKASLIDHKSLINNPLHTTPNAQTNLTNMPPQVQLPRELRQRILTLALTYPDPCSALYETWSRQAFLNQLLKPVTSACLLKCTVLREDIYHIVSRHILSMVRADLERTQETLYEKADPGLAGGSRVIVNLVARKWMLAEGLRELEWWVRSHVGR